MDKEIIHLAPGKQYEIVIDTPPITKWQRFQVRMKLWPLQRKYTLRPLLIGNFQRVAPAFRQLPKEIRSGNLAVALEHVTWQHLDNIVYIVAVGLQNNRREPSRTLINIIRDYLSTEEKLGLLFLVKEQCHFPDFISSIVTIKGPGILDGLKTKPLQDNTDNVELLEILLNH